MRSRYAAFVRGESAYLHRTLHPDHEDHARGATALAASMAKHARATRYEALRILDRDGPDRDGIARVLFHVTMKIAGKDASFVELSSFAHDGTGWRYVGGITRAAKIDRAAALTIASFERATS
jgi:SEC-C motif-containing protein